MLKRSVVAIALVCASCATPEVSSRNAPCHLTVGDRAWVDRSLAAWRFASENLSEMSVPGSTRAIFFDAACILTSPDALDADVPLASVTWSSAPHKGTITLPDGEKMDAGVLSYASGAGPVAYFVMSTPSVWEAGGVSGGTLSLENLMTAVLLHEASHVAQVAPYGPRLDRLISANRLADGFNDDTMQRRFESDAEFAESIRRETELFRQAANASSDTEARRLAREARDLMRARAARWFTGPDSYWSEAEDIWLTFEGAGQWLGYQWLVHPAGAAVPAADTEDRWMQSRWWSQTEGLAVVSALHRLAGDRWQASAYGDGSQTVLEMLDAALAERPSGS